MPHLKQVLWLNGLFFFPLSRNRLDVAEILFPGPLNHITSITKFSMLDIDIDINIEYLVSAENM